jgi:hypothetical protein
LGKGNEHCGSSRVKRTLALLGEANMDGYPVGPPRQIVVPNREKQA